jgi:hypothetical protein
VRHGPDAAPAPPGRLRVGGDADLRAEHRARDVRRVAVTRLDAVVVVAGGHEDDRLAVGSLEDACGVRRDQGAAREGPEHHGLEVRERGVVALYRHDGLPRLDPVAVPQRMDGQPRPVVGAELEDRDRLVHASEHRLPLLEDLHHHTGTAAVVEQRRARVVEVRVAVVAVAHLLDGEVEDLGVEPRPARTWPGDRHAAARSASSTAWSAASATSSCSALGSLVDSRRWSSVPGRARARESRLSRCLLIQPKTSTAAPTAPIAPTILAVVRCRAGASSAAAPASAVAIVSGPTRCEPHRSCSFGARSPVS